MRLLKLVPDDTNIKFLKYRWPFFIVSLILIAASWALVLTKASTTASISQAGKKSG